MSRFAKPLSCALGVVPGPGGTVTFVRQLNGPYAGNWLLPGGGTEIGETAEQTARREIREETGCEVDRLDPFAVYEFTGVWEQGPYHLVMFAFRAVGTFVVPPDFLGHNVGAIRQARPDDIELHSTDLQILTDAGVASYPPDRINRALTEDGITAVVHRISSSTSFNVRPFEQRSPHDVHNF